jgi:hypothetical protein
MVYRLVQECFNNIAKHSGANSVNISVSSADGWVRLAVEDNGVGFKVEEALARKDSFGLSGMRERVALLGGRFDIRSYPKNGLGTGDVAPVRRKTGRGTRILNRSPLNRSGEGPREGPEPSALDEARNHPEAELKSEKDNRTDSNLGKRYGKDSNHAGGRSYPLSSRY